MKPLVVVYLLTKIFSLFFRSKHLIYSKLEQKSQNILYELVQFYCINNKLGFYHFNQIIKITLCSPYINKLSDCTTIYFADFLYLCST